MKLYYAALTLLLALTGCSANTTRPQPSRNQLEMQKWQRRGIASYMMEINIAAHSTARGTWRITVEQNKVVKLTRKGKPVQVNPDSMLGSLTMDRLYQLAERPNAYTEYHPEGHIQSLRVTAARPGERRHGYGIFVRRLVPAAAADTSK